MKSKIVNLKQMKKLLDKDVSIKMEGAYFYNNDTVYHVIDPKYSGMNNAMSQVTKYYCGLESRTLHVNDENFIKDLVWNKKAINFTNNGRLVYDGIVYDGGDFAKQETAKRWQAEKKRYQKIHREWVINSHNTLIERKAKEILNNYSVKITDEAKNKAHTIAERMVHLTGPNEIYLQGVDFLDRKNNSAIRDIYISDGQFATPSDCGRPSIQSTTDKLNEKGQYRVAWVHSHANMSTFHSSTDDRNLKWQIWPFGKKIDIEISHMGYKSKRTLNIYPSLVFNAKRSSPYVEASIGYFPIENPDKPREGTGEKYFSRKNIPLEILLEKNNIDSSFETIDKEIYERVIWPRRSVSEELEDFWSKNYGISHRVIDNFFEKNGGKRNVYVRNRNDRDIIFERNKRKVKDSENKILINNSENRRRVVNIPVNEKELSKKDLYRRVSFLEKGYNILVRMYNNLLLRVNQIKAE